MSLKHLTLVSHHADEEEEGKKGKKSPEEKPTTSGKKDPVTFVSDSGETCGGSSVLVRVV